MNLSNGLVSNDSSEQNESDYDDNDENINKINEFIEKLDMLNNNYDLKIKLNRQRENENYVNNIDNINIYIKKHESFKKKLNEINNFFKKKCNYDAFSKIEKVYVTISNINSSYEFISLKIKIQDYIENIEKNIKNNYLNTIPYLNLFLQIRKKIHKYSSLYFFYSKNEKYNIQNSNFLKKEETIIENDIIDYVNYKKTFIFQNVSDKKNEHAQVYNQIYEMDKEKINLLNKYYNNVKRIIEEEIIEYIRKKDIDNIKNKIKIYLSLFQNQEKEYLENKTCNSNISSPNENESEEMRNNENKDEYDGSNTDYEEYFIKDNIKTNTKEKKNVTKKINSENKDNLSFNKSEYEQSIIDNLGENNKNSSKDIKPNKKEESKIINNIDDYLIYFDEYLFICYVTISLVEIEIDKLLDLLNSKIMSNEDNVYIECIKNTYSCFFKYNKFFENLVHDHIVYIIYNRKIELIFNKVINVIFKQFFSQVKLSIENFDELNNYDKNIEILSLLCYNFLNIKKFLYDLSFKKFEKVNNIFDFKNYINTNTFSIENCLYKNLPYINLIQDAICSYIDNEILFSKHCIDKAFILTDDIMLSLIGDEKKDFNFDENFNFDNAINNNEFTSTFLEDAFYIFQKCVCRSINMNDINTICVLINNIMTVLSTTLKDYLKENVKTSKNIYSSFIHDMNNLKNFSFTNLLNSIDKNNYFEENSSKTILLAQNFVNSFTYINNENNKTSNTAINLSKNNFSKDKTSFSNNISNQTKNIYDFLTPSHYENLFNPLMPNQNIKNQIINSKFSYPHCINNIDSCYQYIQKYKVFINDYFTEQFLHNNKEKKEVQNYLLMFNNSLAIYDNLLKDYEKLNIENCKILLNILKIHFINQLILIEDINFDITNEQYSYYQLNDPYISNLINRIKLILHHISLYFNQNIFHICIHLLAEKICKYIERIIKKKKFNLYGCVQIDNDIRNLMLFFTSLTNTNVKKEFSKLFDICELLNISDLQDFKDLYDENKNNLNSNEIENILSLRNDISEELLKSIKLYINSKIK
ncbi:conserved Plasmodium protein, unknown function [Plasmodium gallinaceum]|uniref:Conserved oligomeric Golgi complex subunit 4 C-terminal domain-containing protein n=1 Tax=Plasmodium gallinaceum TaxID=5849 RepID=A0A1J1GN33_PLAGA|nr:conserved Plasmodium protein, unknown function [Plasmodium gallinaceum]CRG93739.1 conserved Plasmodium protein, unknown function [Plasmodium gallinaceum]